MEFKEAIKQARLKSGLSQEKAGAAINRTRNAIKGYEEGISSPNPDQLAILCKLYNTTPNDLLGFNLKQKEEAKMNNENNQNIAIREIKFRAWDKQFQIITKVLPDGYKFTFDGKVILLDHKGKEIRESEDFILMQYTGFKDKNGKEIYEGDILECSLDGTIYPIVWEEEYFRFRIKGTPKGFSHQQAFSSAAQIERTAEVIGNIYENPELLGGE